MSDYDYEDEQFEEQSGGISEEIDEGGYMPSFAQNKSNVNKNTQKQQQNINQQKQEEDDDDFLSDFQNPIKLANNQNQQSPSIQQGFSQKNIQKQGSRFNQPSEFDQQSSFKKPNLQNQNTFQPQNVSNDQFDDLEIEDIEEQTNQNQIQIQNSDYKNNYDQFQSNTKNQAQKSPGSNQKLNSLKDQSNQKSQNSNKQEKLVDALYGEESENHEFENQPTLKNNNQLNFQAQKDAQETKQQNQFLNQQQQNYQQFNNNFENQKQRNIDTNYNNEMIGHQNQINRKLYQQQEGQIDGDNYSYQQQLQQESYQNNQEDLDESNQQQQFDYQEQSYNNQYNQRNQNQSNQFEDESQFEEQKQDINPASYKLENQEWRDQPEVDVDYLTDLVNFEKRNKLYREDIKRNVLKFQRDISKVYSADNTLQSIRENFLSYLQQNNPLLAQKWGPKFLSEKDQFELKKLRIKQQGPAILQEKLEIEKLMKNKQELERQIKSDEQYEENDGNNQADENNQSYHEEVLNDYNNNYSVSDQKSAQNFNNTFGFSEKDLLINSKDNNNNNQSVDYLGDKKHYYKEEYLDHNSLKKTIDKIQNKYRNNKLSQNKEELLNRYPDFNKQNREPRFKTKKNTYLSQNNSYISNKSDTEDRWESNKKHNSSILSKKKNRKIKTPNVRRDSVNSEGQLELIGQKYLISTYIELFKQFKEVQKNYLKYRKHFMDVLNKQTGEQFNDTDEIQSDINYIVTEFNQLLNQGIAGYELYSSMSHLVETIKSWLNTFFFYKSFQQIYEIYDTYSSFKKVIKSEKVHENYEKIEFQLQQYLKDKYLPIKYMNQTQQSLQELQQYKQDYYPYYMKYKNEYKYQIALNVYDSIKSMKKFFENYDIYYENIHKRHILMQEADDNYAFASEIYKKIVVYLKRDKKDSVFQQLLKNFSFKFEKLEHQLQTLKPKYYEQKIKQRSNNNKKNYL
ncbi:hypothetical protein PPERSA_05186 [Pseudocohnilembus persalinus]|uniref:Uncharacterized protein n=1 Tax=Pseudocohnilembus persalinus TaxID=266149 RepID=A0A0V0R9W8_PSEPJ|nr:hypothetical protein PPERSA_05186 [Pseudocohnilembus persalinus]|eukprot:KRX11077.1 hypothetical protein PPERSA_05186 [Pseudocohnilembus persalinus]